MSSEIVKMTLPARGAGIKAARGGGQDESYGKEWIQDTAKSWWDNMSVDKQWSIAETCGLKPDESWFPDHWNNLMPAARRKLNWYRVRGSPRTFAAPARRASDTGVTMAAGGDKSLVEAAMRQAAALAAAVEKMKQSGKFNARMLQFITAGCGDVSHRLMELSYSPDGS